MATNALANERRASVPMYTKRLNDHEVRLLIILPGKGEAPIECKLSVYETNNVPAYEALSYVWGTSTNLKPILCNGSRVDVTENLLFALKQLRYEDERRLIWIDYVCINQDDNDEKTEQVQLMKNIYSEASRVVVSITYKHWYHGPKITVEAIELMEKLRGAGKSIKSALSLSEEVYAGPEALKKKLAKEVVENSEKIRAFLGFMRDPWFTRIWCVQEIVLARDAVMLFGCDPPSKVSWKRIMPLIPWWLEQEMDVSQSWGEKVHKAVCSVHDTLSTTRYNLDSDSRGLLYALSDFRHRKATNPRDKVYALLGLIDWKYNTSSLIPDYSKSIYDVYFDAAKSIIQTTGDLSLLAAAESTDLDHPSWVPLWNEDSPSLDVRLLNLWSACGDHKAGNPVKMTRDMLRVVGCTFDRVDHAGSWLEPHRNSKLLDRFTRDKEAATQQILELWFRVHEDNRLRNKDLDSQIRTMASTLIHGLMDDQQPVCDNTEPELKMEFLTFMKSMLLEFTRTIRERFDPDYNNRAGSHWEDPDYISRRRLFNALYGCYQAKHSIPVHKDFTETHYARLAEIRLRGKRIFYTSDGYFGIGPRLMQKDDIVVVLNGATIPYVLRPLKTSHEFKLVGSCYIHDVMDGEWYSSAIRREISGCGNIGTVL